mmetsp:Transcript_20150/g.22489  ORF Transcript_20150/g.22489 Transcript_20150/m.22489 type:complete len:122 (+) Transcript_20150:23-388(+)
MYNREEKKYAKSTAPHDPSRQLKTISRAGLKDLSCKTSKFKTDLSSLKSRVYSLRSENHVKAPELDELDWMEDYMASQHHKDKKVPKASNKSTKSINEPKMGSASAYNHEDIKKQFNMLMK